MKRLLPLLLALLALPFNASPNGDKISKEVFASGGRQRSFYLFVPATVTKSSTVPLLITLHGSGRNGLLLVEKWQDLANREGVIVVGPDALDPQQWATPEDGPYLLHDLVETLRAKYPIDPRRVYLFGHSAGATFALYMSCLESEYFAAAAIHAGALAVNEYAMADEAERKIPIAIFVGTRDPLYPLDVVRATTDALKARGIPVELTEIPGHDHNYYARAAEINRKAWEFLKRYQLPAQPQFQEYRLSR